MTDSMRQKISKMRMEYLAFLEFKEGLIKLLPNSHNDGTMLKETQESMKELSMDKAEII